MGVEGGCENPSSEVNRPVRRGLVDSNLSCGFCKTFSMTSKQSIRLKFPCFRIIAVSGGFLFHSLISLFLFYLSGPSQTQKNQGEGDLHTRVAGPARLATEGRSKRSHWCSLLDCLPSTIEPEATSNNSNFIVLQLA